MSRRLLLLVLVMLVGAAACAEAPTADTSSSATGPSPGPASPLLAIEEELKDLDPVARTNRLVELARAEAAVTTLYTSTTFDDSEVIIEEFRKKYGLDVELFRASSTKVLQRVLLEAEADFSGADVVLTGALELAVLADEELLVALNTPATADILDAAVYPTWAGVYLQTFVAAWNTNELDEADAPSTWEEVLTQYPDGLAMELGDFDWFSTLVQRHFVDELGYSEADAVDLFRQAAEVATLVDGHTLMAELLAAGEFDLVASAYQARVDRIKGKKGPIEWEPAVEPLVVRPNGAGVHRDTDTPATALLFVEFLLTDAQPIFSDLGRTPASTTTAGGLAPGYDILAVDVVGLNQSREKWENLYASIVELSFDAVVYE